MGERGGGRFHLGHLLACFSSAAAIFSDQLAGVSDVPSHEWLELYSYLSSIRPRFVEQANGLSNTKQKFRINAHIADRIVKEMDEVDTRSVCPCTPYSVLCIVVTILTCL